MRKFIIDGVQPSVVKVTRDTDLFGVPPTDAEFGEYATLEARVDVENFLNLRRTGDDDPKSDSGYSVSEKTKISLEPNPRGQKLTTEVARAIQSSLLDRDGHFHRKNRGILLAVENFHYDNKTGQLSWTEGDIEEHGCVDGGHTLAVIDKLVGGTEWAKAADASRKRAAEDGRSPADAVKPQFVTLQIVKGLKADELAEVAGARNNSVNVEKFALQELEDKFDFLKKELEKAGLLHLIAFKQNEVGVNGKIADVVFVLQCMTTLDNVEFAGEQNQPYHAYWSRSKTVRDFIKVRKNFERIAMLAPDALALPEYIISKYRDWYQKGSGKSNTGRPAFGRTSECKSISKPTDFHFLPIVRKQQSAPSKVAYTLRTNALAMPILSALRTIVSNDSKKATWLADPYEFVDRIGPTVVDSLSGSISSMRGAATVVLKNKEVWKNLYVQAKMAALMEGILKIDSAAH